MDFKPVVVDGQLQFIQAYIKHESGIVEKGYLQTIKPEEGSIITEPMQIDGSSLALMMPAPHISTGDTHSVSVSPLLPAIDIDGQLYRWWNTAELAHQIELQQRILEQWNESGGAWTNFAIPIAGMSASSVIYGASGFMTPIIAGLAAVAGGAWMYEQFRDSVELYNAVKFQKITQEILRLEWENTNGITLNDWTAFELAKKFGKDGDELWSLPIDGVGWELDFEDDPPPDPPDPPSGTDVVEVPDLKKEIALYVASDLLDQLLKQALARMIWVLGVVAAIFGTTYFLLDDK